MKNMFNRPSLPDPVVAVQEHDNLERVIALAKAQGYAEALTDLVESLKTCNSFALVSVEPAVRRIQYKAKLYAHQAKGE